MLNEHFIELAFILFIYYKHRTQSTLNRKTKQFKVEQIKLYI